MISIFFFYILEVLLVFNVASSEKLERLGTSYKKKYTKYHTIDDYSQMYRMKIDGGIPCYNNNECLIIEGTRDSVPTNYKYCDLHVLNHPRYEKFERRSIYTRNGNGCLIVCKDQLSPIIYLDKSTLYNRIRIMSSNILIYSPYSREEKTVLMCEYYSVDKSEGKPDSFATARFVVEK